MARDLPNATFRPAPPFIVLHRGGLLFALTVIIVILVVFGLSVSWLIWILLFLLVVLLAVLAWNLLVFWAERYTLAPDRLIWESGVLRKLRVEVPLDRLQTLVVYRSLAERVFGLGTIGVATAGTDGYELVWSSLARPDAVLADIRAAAAAHAGRANDRPVTSASPSSHRLHALPVIGLAGGIGAGKSAVASHLAAMGCLVIDSDQRARAALDRPEVRDQLVTWWGPGILGADGRVERSRVAEIIFRDPAERARLEGLVHPIVRQDRAAMIAEAAAASSGGAPRPAAVVIDAPLLFEAGLDRECDGVIFVDAPREQRLRRVQASRGWTEAELSRREQSQWPLERKRSAATWILDNADGVDPAPALREILTEVVEKASEPGR